MTDIDIFNRLKDIYSLLEKTSYVGTGSARNIQDICSIIQAIQSEIVARVNANNQEKSGGG